MAKPYSLVNEVQSTLSVAFVHGTDASLTLTSVAGFPTGGGYIRVGDYDATHWVLYEYTGIATNDLTGLTACTLGVVESEAAYTFAIGTVVEVANAAEMVKDVRDEAVHNTDFDAQSIIAAVTDNTPVKLTVAEQTLVGRITGGNIVALTATESSAIVHSVGLAADWDIGTHGFRALNLTADGLTSGRVIFAGANGLLSDDAGLAFGSNLLTVTKTAIGVTQGDYGLALVNTTDAADGAQQYSPPIRLRGEGWDADGSVTNTVDFRVFVRPIQGNDVTGGLDFQSSINGAAYTDLMTLTSAGGLMLGTQTLTNVYNPIEFYHSDAVAWGVTFRNPAGLVQTQYNGYVTGGDSTIARFTFLNGTDSIASLSAYRFGADDAAAFLFSTQASAVGGLLTRMVVDPNGNVGIGTTVPSKILDVNDGSGNMIADGYDSHPASENIVAIDVAGMANKLKSFGLMMHTRTPFVSAGELRTATIEHFSPGRWVKAFGGKIVKDEKGVKRIEGDNYHGGKLRTCPDETMLAFLDSTADTLREERRPLPEWTRKHTAPNLHDPTAVGAMGDIVSYDNEGKITGYSLNNYVGFLHGVIMELVARVEALEADGRTTTDQVAR